MSSHLTLFELANTWQELAETLASTVTEDGEIDAAIAERLNGTEADIREKIINGAAVVAVLESAARAKADAAKRLAAQAKTAENNAARLAEYLRQHMARLGLDRLEDPAYPHLRVRRVKNPPRRDTVNEALIPDEYWIETFYRKLDGQKVLKDLKAGVEVPGARLVQAERLVVE